MHPRLVLPVALAGRPFTVAEGRAHGLTEKQLRSAVLRAPARGVRVPAALPDTLAMSCLATSLVLPTAAAFDATTAAALRGLPLPRGVDPAEPLVVRVPDPRARPRIAGVRVRVGRCPAGTPRHGAVLRVVSDAEAWAALAADSSFPADELVVVGDAIARRRGGLADLRRTARAYQGTRGARRMRTAVGLVRERVDSPQETRTRLVVLAAGIPEPLVNVDAFASDGSGWLCRPDLSWPTVRVALEYDGLEHLRSTRRRKDIARREAMDRNGPQLVSECAGPARMPEDLGRIPRTRGVTPPCDAVPPICPAAVPGCRPLHDTLGRAASGRPLRRPTTHKSAPRAR